MEYLQNGFILELSPGAFPLSTDSIALGSFVKLPKNAQVVDLGAGCGTLGLMLCARDSSCCVTGIELDETAHRMALQNAQTNGICHRLKSICADLTDRACLPPAGSADCVVSNPPYFSGGFVSKATPLARSQQACPLEAVFGAAAHCLRFGGELFMVHKPEQLGQLCALGIARRLEPKELLMLHHKEDGPCSLVLLRFRKGAKPGLTISQQTLFDRQGQTTAYYKDIYHL